MPIHSVLGVLALAAGVQGQAPAGGVRWVAVLEQPDAWYGTAEARRLADIVLQYQMPAGGWPKDIDMTLPPEQAPPERLQAGATIDNGATTTQVRLVSRIHRHSPETRYAAAVNRGIAYLLDAQYPNGGWPQVFPLERGYSRHITFNDNAMVSVMRLLDEIGRGERDFAFVAAAVRKRSAAAVTRGVDITLRAQIRVNGRLTAWCAQHDEVTLEPRGARTYEHPSLSGQETVGIVRFLMARPDSREPRITAAIDAAVRWLKSAQLTGWKLEQRTAPDTPRGWDRVMVRDPSAPPLWARFYDIQTNHPIYSGRDGTIRERLEDIEYERRTGYAWVGEWPRSLLELDYPRWKDATARQ